MQNAECRMQNGRQADRVGGNACPRNSSFESSQLSSMSPELPKGKAPGKKRLLVAGPRSNAAASSLQSAVEACGWKCLSPEIPGGSNAEVAEVAEKDGNRVKADPFDSASPRSGQAAYRSEGHPEDAEKVACPLFPLSPFSPFSPGGFNAENAEDAEKDGNRVKADPFDSASPRSGQAAHRREGHREDAEKVA